MTNLETLKQRAKAFDYLFDAVVVTDLQGTIIDWNKGSELLYGYSKEEAIGNAVSMLHVPEDSEAITSMVIEAVQKSGKWSGEVRMLHKNGHIGWIESMCVPIFDDKDEMTGALGINRDITERVNESERLQYLAHYDQLTETPNRYLLWDRIKHIICQSERNKTSFSLFFIDLDEFKVINDTKGHAYGDRVLVEAAKRLKKSVRKSDTVARVGGDEFVLVLENIASKEQTDKLAKLIIKELSKPFKIKKEQFELSCSIGIAIYPQDGETTDELLSAADMAMYRAKKNGRSTFEY